MALPRGTSDIVGGSSCLIHVPEKLGIWDPLPCKLRGSLEAGDANARLRGDARASSLFNPRCILLACGNSLGRVGETRSPEPTEQQPAPQRSPGRRQALCPGLPCWETVQVSPNQKREQFQEDLRRGRKLGGECEMSTLPYPAPEAGKLRQPHALMRHLPKPQGRDPKGWR